MSRNEEHISNGAAAEGVPPIGGAAGGGASVFFVSAHIHAYFLHIPHCVHILSTCCPHFVYILSTFWKLREVYMLKKAPHDSLYKCLVSKSDYNPTNFRLLLLTAIQVRHAIPIISQLLECTFTQFSRSSHHKLVQCVHLAVCIYLYPF